MVVLATALLQVYSSSATAILVVESGSREALGVLQSSSLLSSTKHLLAFFIMNGGKTMCRDNLPRK